MKTDSVLNIGRSATMEEDKFRTRMKKIKRRYNNVTPALLRITVSVITMVLLLLTICCGFRLTMEPWRYRAIGTQAFHVGVSTIVFGFLALIVGLSILADMLWNIAERIPELSGMNQGQQEPRTLSKAIGQGLVAVVTTLVFVWATYTGFRLATESGEVLTVSVGVTTILFGFIYFIIGLAIVQELILDFLTHSQ